MVDTLETLCRAVSLMSSRQEVICRVLIISVVIGVNSSYLVFSQLYVLIWLVFSVVGSSLQGWVGNSVELHCCLRGMKLSTVYSSSPWSQWFQLIISLWCSFSQLHIPMSSFGWCSLLLVRCYVVGLWNNG